MRELVTCARVCMCVGGGKKGGMGAEGRRAQPSAKAAGTHAAGNGCGSACRPKRSHGAAPRASRRGSAACAARHPGAAYSPRPQAPRNAEEQQVGSAAGKEQAGGVRSCPGFHPVVASRSRRLLQQADHELPADPKAQAQQAQHADGHLPPPHVGIWMRILSGSCAPRTPRTPRPAAPCDVERAQQADAPLPGQSGGPQHGAAPEHAHQAQRLRRSGRVTLPRHQASGLMPAAPRDQGIACHMASACAAVQGAASGASLANAAHQQHPVGEMAPLSQLQVDAREEGVARRPRQQTVGGAGLPRWCTRLCGVMRAQKGRLIKVAVRRMTVEGLDVRGWTPGMVLEPRWCSRQLECRRQRRCHRCCLSKQARTVQRSSFGCAASSPGFHGDLVLVGGGDGSSRGLARPCPGIVGSWVYCAKQQ